jgi:DNA invertase Pin-like site-specific DNA recombinase
LQPLSLWPAASNSRAGVRQQHLAQLGLRSDHDGAADYQQMRDDENNQRWKASGKSMKNRPELEKAIDMLGTGDILVVAEWDRATRSMFDGIEIIKRVNDRGALIKVLDKPHLDLTTPLGRGFVAFLSAMAEDERQRILARCNAGRVVAIAKGVRFGPKPKLTDHQRDEALKRLEAGESCRSIAKTMAVHHATIARLAA